MFNELKCIPFDSRKTPVAKRSFAKFICEYSTARIGTVIFEASSFVNVFTNRITNLRLNSSPLSPN